MSLDLSPLAGAPRLLIEAELKPLQGTRFQPTGFPNLGAARYAGPKGEKMLLVESNQSVANHLEAVCIDQKTRAFIDCLQGIPYIQVNDDIGGMITSSLEESHRLNSRYIEDSVWFEEEFGPALGFGLEKGKWARAGDAKDKPIDFKRKIYPAILRFDPNSLIHGVFLESIAGQIRVPRSLGGFIEAEDCNIASSGGARIDKVTLSKGGGADAKQGTGNVIYARDEFTAKRLVAYFNLDLAQIHGFGLGRLVERFLISFALFKIQVLLSSGLRLRTACDLTLVAPPKATAPSGFVLPELAELQTELPALIKAAGDEGLFAKPRVTTVVYRKK
jgi:CRISPR-associated protein Csb1